MNDIFRQIAKENGTTEKAVKEEMQFAIREAMKSAWVFFPDRSHIET